MTDSGAGDQRIRLGAVAMNQQLKSPTLSFCIDSCNLCGVDARLYRWLSLYMPGLRHRFLFND